MLVWTQLAPAVQTGQVGERRRINLGEPSAPSKSAAICSIPPTSRNAANSWGVAPEAHADAIAVRADMRSSNLRPIANKLGPVSAYRAGPEVKHCRKPDRPNRSG